MKLRVLSFLITVLAVSVAAGPSPAAAQSLRHVPAGGNLQAALDAAQPGDTITLEAGATYVGNFVLPAKGGSAYITVRSSAADHQLPPAGTRIDPRYAPLLPKLRSPNSSPALATAPRAHHYRLLFLELQANARGAGNVLALGDGSRHQNSLGTVPHDLVVDRVYLHGDPAEGQKRGIALNSASTMIVNSYIADIKAVGQDSQAIGGWNGPGPYVISNNYLEAAGENVMFGGSDPAIPGLVPSDITFTRNHLAKPLAWRSSRWLVKNLFELKSAQRVTVDGNLFENNWAAAQAGYAILLKSVNQDGGAPWSVVQHVSFTNNVVRHVSSAVNILGRDTAHAAIEANHISFRNNLFEDVSGGRYGGVGRFLLVNGGLDITFEHNTVINEGASTIFADGRPSAGFVFVNNILLDNGQGIKGSGTGVGTATLARFFPGGHVVGNVVVGANAALYPIGNHYPPSTSAVGFADASRGNYRLSGTSPFKRAATDGGDPGCDMDAIERAMGAAPPSTPPAPGPGVPPPGGPGVPGRPGSVRADVMGSAVRISWAPPPSGSPAAYVIEAGTMPGAVNVGTFHIGDNRTTVVATDVPPGVYYLRLRAVAGGGAGEASEDVRVVVGDVAQDCRQAPAAPVLRASVDAGGVTLAWRSDSSACGATQYRLLAGSTRGASNLVHATVAGTSLRAQAPAGTYYVRVVATNAHGASAASNEVIVTVRP